MCGIAGIVGPGCGEYDIDRMVAAEAHRGPDDAGTFVSPSGQACLGHRRLSIIDLSAEGRGPMSDADGSKWITFNGEIYNYRELREDLSGYPFRTKTDTEVLLAAYERWGADCLDRLIGMFSFAIWDEHEQELFAARDRFGVKPLNYNLSSDGTLVFASEIAALHAAGVDAEPDPISWASYLASGLSDQSESTFWKGIKTLPPGHLLRWKGGRLRVEAWYDLADAAGPDLDVRPVRQVVAEYRALLEESVRLRFRADVPVGINVSGGLDSSILLAIVRETQGEDAAVAAFTFVTGDPAYDELPWVTEILRLTDHPLITCPLTADEVPDLALSVAGFEDGPYGGLPTLAYAHIFESARDRGVKVLLDGQGLDEQWAGYDYYRDYLGGGRWPEGPVRAPVQGSLGPVDPSSCLEPEFRMLAERFLPPEPFSDPLRDRQYCDARYLKIPRVLRFNDNVSMRSSCELREPFLDHRLFEVALRQPSERKIRGTIHKALLRDLAADLLPSEVLDAPKRPVQTPQREWLRGPLRGWAREHIDAALDVYGGSWLDRAAVVDEWDRFARGEGDSSFHVWQWVNLSLWHQSHSLGVSA